MFVSANAQNNITSSPYSLFGIGDPLTINNTMGLSMGDVKYAMDRPFYLNTANPASYASLKAATFSLGAMLNRTRTFNTETSQDNDNGSLRYFGLGIPLTKKLGISLGAKPFTSLGYGIQLNSVGQVGDYYTRYEGQGGMNIVHGGIGYKILKDSIQSVSIGTNANFYFGNNKQTTLNNLEQVPGALNSLFRDNSVTSDFGFDVGVLYSLRLNKLLNKSETYESTLTIGGSYSLPTHLKTRFESFSGAYYYSSSRIFVITDTLSYSLDTTSIYLPKRFGIGVNYEIFNRHTKNLWIIELDYEFNGWSKLAVNGKNSGLENSTQYSVGMQFVPDANGIRDFFKLMRYRVGFNYKDTRISVTGNQITDMSVTAGFGIPLVKSKSIFPSSSTIDLGVTVGNRGSTSNGLIREQYTNVYIGLSFSPNYWDRWFKKRKIN
jgi:hypothetical protein